MLASVLLSTVGAVGLTAAADPGPACWYNYGVDPYYCRVRDSDMEHSMVGAGDPLECYQACHASRPACVGFTWKRIASRDPVCFLLLSPCDQDPGSGDTDWTRLVSGPAECAGQNPTCNTIPGPAEGQLHWQCRDAQYNWIDPYTAAGSPVGTVCTQSCDSWEVECPDESCQAQLQSTCLPSRQWSEVSSTYGSALVYPAPPYPAPDEPALSCGCRPLHIRWPYTESGVYYNPEQEEAVRFECTDPDIFPGGNKVQLAVTNECEFYCDSVHVGSVACRDGEWTGEPELGFWCYNQPEQYYDDCAEGWRSHGSHCYQLRDNGGEHFNNRSECEAECRQEGGNLVSIHSEEENSFVAAIQNKWTWTGATNVGNCTWAWTDGTAWDYENWGTSEPDCQGDLNCAEIGYWIGAPEKWADGPCSWSFIGSDCVCKKCREGWSEFNGRCYKLLDNGGSHYKTRDACAADCSEQGGQLASVHSEEENTFIVELQNRWTWLGATHVGNCTFEWTDGTAWDYDNWGTNEPHCSDSPDYACVFIGYMLSTPELWYDSACNWYSSFSDCVCKL